MLNLKSNKNYTNHTLLLADLSSTMSYSRNNLSIADNYQGILDYIKKNNRGKEINL